MKPVALREETNISKRRVNVSDIHVDLSIILNWPLQKQVLECELDLSDSG
jgi:hypothetical protein